MPNFSQKISISFFKSSRDVFTVIGFSIKNLEDLISITGRKVVTNEKPKLKQFLTKTNLLLLLIYEIYIQLFARQFLYL